MDPVTIRAFHDELEKIAVRAGVRAMQRLAQKGTPEAMAQVQNIARSGAIKPGGGGATGYTLKRLGVGGEGVADLVHHPQFGVSVRKLYNPNSQFGTPEMFQRKVQFAKQVQSPQLAETLGVGRTGRGGRMSFHEYVPGGAPTSQEASAIQGQVRQQGAAKGWDPYDVRADNIRGGKAIDVTPMRAGEMEGATFNWMHPRPGSNLDQRGVWQKPSAMSDQNMKRLLGGGGGSAKPLSQVPMAPGRGPINVPSTPLNEGQIRAQPHQRLNYKQHLKQQSTPAAQPAAEPAAAPTPMQGASTVASPIRRSPPPQGGATTASTPNAMAAKQRTPALQAPASSAPAPRKETWGSRGEL